MLQYKNKILFIQTMDPFLIKTASAHLSDSPKGENPATRGIAIMTFSVTKKAMASLCDKNYFRNHFLCLIIMSARQFQLPRDAIAVLFYPGSFQFRNFGSWKFLPHAGTGSLEELPASRLASFFGLKPLI